MTCDLCAEAAASEWLAALDPESDEPVVDVLGRACYDDRRAHI